MMSGFDLVASGFATNGYGDHSPGHYTLAAAFVCEVVMTAFWIFLEQPAALRCVVRERLGSLDAASLLRAHPATPG
jgi:hypothetical protein